jgi:hypothetical protein
MTLGVRLSIVVILLRAPACSNSEHVTSRDAGPDANQEADAPLMDAGEAPARDGAPLEATVPLDAGPPVDASALVEATCTNLAKYTCESLEACDPSEYPFASLSACEAPYQAICGPNYAAYAQLIGVSFVQSVLACLQAEIVLGPGCAMSSGATAGDLKNAFEACSVVYDTGTVALGGACFISPQCREDLRCVLPTGQVCGGTCQPAASMGEACSNEVECDSSLYCDPYAHICRLAAAGQPCGSSTMQTGVCGTPPGPSLFCYANTCVAWQEQGQPCSATAPCDPSNLLFCSSAETCQPATIGTGAPCNGSCAGNYYCDPTNHCAAPLGAGGTCTTGTANMCDSTQGLACIGGTCQLDYILPGQPCGAAEQCWRGTCIQSDDGGVQQTCAPYLPPGAPCVNTGGEPQCAAPYACYNGECALPTLADAGLPDCN